MKRKIGLEGLVKNYDYEVDNEIDVGHSIEWYNLHADMLYKELCEIREALLVFKEVEKEWDKRAANRSIVYSEIRTIIYNALPYRIVMGLSKIFVGTKEFSLEKTINVLSQREEYRNNKNIKDTIKNIQFFLENSVMVKNITEYRDNFFAHLDVSCVMSDIRISPDVAIHNISIEEVEKAINLLEKLCEKCFEIKLENPWKGVSREEILKTFFWK